MKPLRMLLAFLFAVGVVALSEPSFVSADDAKTKAAQKEELRKKLKELAKKKLEADAAAKKAAKPVTPATPTAVVPAKPAIKLPAVLPPAAVARQIDKQIDARLKAENVPPSSRTTDAEFLRRVYLDLTGTIPSPDDARAFLDSTSPNKREKLVDSLLASPNFGKHLSDLWANKLFPKDSDNRFVTKVPLRDWFAAEFNKNTSWAEMTTKLLSATGGVDEHPEVTFFLANRSIDKLTDDVGTHFLGQSVACAQCHNHPFTSMKQTEYWELAAFFSKVSIDRPKNPNQGGDNSKIGVRELTVASKQKDFFPEAAIKTSPKFLNDATPALAEREPYRPALAAWVTSTNNPYFAKTMVNQTWALLFGKGIVFDLDDMRDCEEATHPDTLTFLSLQFAANKFNLKDLYKAIVLTETYQRTSKPLPSNAKDEELYSHQMVKVMMPEQLFDSLMMVNKTTIDNVPAVKGKDAKVMAPKGKNPEGFRDAFVNFFLSGADEANQAEYEAGIPQALRLMNSRFNMANNPNAYRAFYKPGMTPEKFIEEMYLTVLSRRPTSEEITRLMNYLQQNGRESAGDIFWALMNSSEFVLIR